MVSLCSIALCPSPKLAFRCWQYRKTDGKLGGLRNEATAPDITISHFVLLITLHGIYDGCTYYSSTKLDSLENNDCSSLPPDCIHGVITNVLFLVTNWPPKNDYSLDKCNLNL